MSRGSIGGLGTRLSRHADTLVAATRGPNHRRMAGSDISRSGRHDDNDERRRLFKRSAPSYVEGRRIVEIFSYADQRPGHRPKPMPSLGFVKMSIHRGRATKRG